MNKQLDNESCCRQVSKTKKTIRGPSFSMRAMRGDINSRRNENVKTSRKTAHTHTRGRQIIIIIQSSNQQNGSSSIVNRVCLIFINTEQQHAHFNHHHVYLCDEPFFFFLVSIFVFCFSSSWEIFFLTFHLHSVCWFIWRVPSNWLTDLELFFRRRQHQRDVVYCVTM